MAMAAGLSILAHNKEEESKVRTRTGMGPCKVVVDDPEEEVLGGEQIKSANCHPEDISKDLTEGQGRPLWIFSAYGPGKNAPRQLFGGPLREKSFEELRLRHYEATAQGKEQLAVQEALQLYNDFQNQMSNIVKNLDAAIQYVVDGEKEHPNRLDIIKTQPPQGANSIGGPSNAQPTFGQPSNAPGLAPNPALGQSTFGQQSGLGEQSSAFGKPATLGGQVSSFGQPTPFGGQQPTFGQPSQPSTFGQPSQPSQPSTFGQPSQPSTFGQPSAFSAPQAQQSTFGQQPKATFGQPPNTLANKPSSFGQPSFGTPSNPTPTPFGSNPTQQSNTLGQPDQATGTFGQPLQSQVTQPQATFGQPVPPASQPNIPRGTNFTPSIASTFNPAASNGPTEFDANGKLRTWHGYPVTYMQLPSAPDTTGQAHPSISVPCYLRPDGKHDRIWFVPAPGGGLLAEKDPKAQGCLKIAGDKESVEAEESAYTDDVKASYEYMAKEGKFKDGIMPSVPPKREWVSFDF